MAKKFLLVAGEPSGDTHGANLAKQILLAAPDTILYGMGGPAMQKAGVKILVSIDQLSVVGITEVFSSIPAHFRAKHDLEMFMDSEKPDAVVLIDYPGFNLRFAKAIKKRRIPIAYYISPQIWAWRAGRIKKIKELIDLMLVILPFEEKIYNDAGVPVRFVGHPLLDEVPQITRSRPQGEPPLIGLLPGSRNVEVTRILTPMCGTAKMIKQDYPDARFFLPLAHTVSRELVERLTEGLDVEITPSPSFPLRANSDFSLTASGTATLENAILGLPMAIVYKVSLFTYSVAKALVRIPMIGLVNIVALRKICPEFIQFDATPPIIYAYTKDFLANKEIQDEMLGNLDEVRKSLGGPGASARAAKTILETF